MVIEISIAVIALAIVALVAAIIALTVAVHKTLIQVDHTLVEVRKQLEEVGEKAAHTMNHASQVSFDLKNKMESLDPIFHVLSNVGEYLEHKTFSLKEEALPASHVRKLDLSENDEVTAPRESIKAADVFEFIDIGLRLWQKIKKRSKQ